MTPTLAVYPEFFAVVQGADRSLYLGGSGSLLRFDGGSWQPIELPNAGPVRTLHRDRKGRVWVGGYDFVGWIEMQADGAARLRVLARPDMPQDAEYLDIWDAFEREEGIYFRALRDLLLYDHEGRPQQRWHHPGRFGAIAQLGPDLILQLRGDRGGLRRLVDGRFEAIAAVPGFARDLVYNLLPLADGRLLLHDVSPRLGLLDATGFRPLRPSLPRSQLDHLTVATDARDGRVVFGGDDGVLRVFDPATPGLSEWRLGGGFVSDLKWDLDGGLLVVDEQGLARLEYPLPWLQIGEADGLRGGIRSVVEHAGRLWVMTGAGVFAAQAGAGLAEGGFRRLDWTSSEAWALLPDEAGLLLAETFALRLVDADGGLRTLGPNDLYPRQLVRSRLRSDRVWVGTEHGLAVLEKDAQGWRLAAREDMPGALVESMHELDDGRLIAVLSGQGLALAQAVPETGTEVAISLTWIERDGGSRPPTRRWVGAVGDAVLVSDASGFRRWDGSVLQSWPMPGLDELRAPGETLALEVAPDGALWALGHAHAYARSAGGAWRTVYAAGPGDGPLGPLLPLGRQVLLGANNRLLLGDRAAGEAPTSPIAPRVASLRYVREGEPVLTLALEPPIGLGPGPGALRIRLAHPDFGAGVPSQFRYRIDATDWSEWSEGGSYELSSPAPGRHRFEYEARRRRGEAIAGEALLFEVEPRWHERRSLQVLLATLLSLALAALLSRHYRGRARRLALRNVELDRLVEQRTTDLEQANRRLRELAERDGLTGVANRRRFDRALADAAAAGGQVRTGPCLLLCDVDNFKRYNDTHGHLAGDALLVRMAELLTEGAPARALVARYGGEEFAVLVPEVDLATAAALAEALRAGIEQQASGATISLGVACFDANAKDPERDLIRRADAALYRAKGEGRNRIGLG